MGYNLPDDWDFYWFTCDRCGKRYHASGTDQCACSTCEKCNEGFYVPEEPEQTHCPKCRKCSECDETVEHYADLIDGMCTSCREYLRHHCTQCGEELSEYELTTGVCHMCV
jgi:hypothetical protein